MVVDVPAERDEEGVDVLGADHGLVVLAAFVGVEVAVKPLDELLDFVGNGHCGPFRGRSCCLLDWQ